MLKTIKYDIFRPLSWGQRIKKILFSCKLNYEIHMDKIVLMQQSALEVYDLSYSKYLTC